MSYAPVLDVSVPDAEIEAGTARLWRSDDHRQFGPWLARAGTFRSRTTNSAAVLGAVEDEEVPGLLAAVEGFYAERGLPARFQLATTRRAENVHRALEAAGYVHDGSTTLVRVAPVRSLRGITPESREGRVRVEDMPSEAWFHQWWVASGRGRGVHGADAEALMELLWDLPGRCAFASHVVDGVVVATGLGVVDGPWAGLSCLASEPSRHGAGSVRRVVAALATWGNSLAARGVHLRVPADDVRLLRFSERCGFTTSYGVETFVARR